MSYRRALLVRWSRRDRLTTVVIAVSVAFLVGTVILVIAAGAQTTALAGQYAATESISIHDSPAAARAAADPTDEIVAFATVTTDDGEERTVVSAQTLSGSPAFGLDPDSVGPDRVTSGAVTRQQTRVLTGQRSEDRTTVVARSSRQIVPDHWYVASPETVQRLGPTGAFRIQTTDDPAAMTTGTPLTGALPFFVFGSSDALRALGIVAAGSAVLIAVVIYSVTRMAVRDRRRTLRIVRATGGRRRTLLLLFGLRAAVIGVVGVALGYAVGVILVNVAVNVAVFAGLPIALDVTLTGAMIRFVAPTLVGTVLIAGGSGMLAAWPTVRGPPLADDGDTPTQQSGRTHRQAFRRLRAVVTPTLLDRRALVPTAATLATFVVFVTVVAGIGGVVTPLTATDTATVTQPGAAHPIASRIPATTAEGLRREGIDASGELLLFQATDGQPFTVRGANFTAFGSVTQAEITAGRHPAGADEAVIGEALAQTLGVERGDVLPLGGITQQRVATVRIVGVYAASGPFDDQLIVPLATAQHLADRPSGTVQFVRADRLPESARLGQQQALRVTSLSAPATVRPNETFRVSVQVENPTGDRVNRSLQLTFDGRTRSVPVALTAGETRRVNASFVAGRQSGTVTVGDRSRTVTIAAPGSVRLSFVPPAAPPNATFQTRLSAPLGSADDTTVTVDGRRVPVDSDGYVSIPVGDGGSTRIVVENDGVSSEWTVPIRSDASRTGQLSVRVQPERPDLLTRPTLVVELSNPWGQPTTREIEIGVAGRQFERNLTVNGSSVGRTRVRLPRQPPGSYDVRVEAVAGGAATTEVTTTYRVTGDARIAATLADGGTTGSSGIGRAVESTFGNLQLVLATLLVLAGLTTVGGTTAVFAQSVHARRRTIGIYRVTGATPADVARIVLADALVIGAAASVVATIIGSLATTLLARAGYLTVFGVRLSTTPSPQVILGSTAGGLVVTLAGAGLATVVLLRVDPAALLQTDQSPTARAPGDQR